jgi:putative colanic acid biosynthesis UDP-glucose lipid carrier transferase
MGTTRDLVEKAKTGRIDIVYVTTVPLSDKGRIIALLDELSDTTASVYIVPDSFLFSMFHGHWVQVGQLPAVSVFETPFYGVEGWLKRLEDIVIASLVLVLMAIPMSLIAILLKLTSPGPILFKQRRYGLDGQVFHIWKFRTMSVCEDSDDGLEQARRNDARVTRFGRFLRQFSLDELPQFFNVLGGSMSVVGPRPHATAHNEHYRKRIKGYMVRHKVRPGITGWAQANGWRGETDTLDKMEARVEYDLWYIRNWSVVLDLKIIFQTALKGWRGVNAY